MWRKTDGEKIATHTHTPLKEVVCQIKRGASACSIGEQGNEKKKKRLLHWHFTSIRWSIKEERWRSPPLDKLTCSAGKYSCLALLPRLPSSQTPPGAKSHSSIFFYFFSCTGHTPRRAASFCFCIRNTTPPGPVTHSLFHWVMMGSIWTQLYFFLLL